MRDGNAWIVRCDGNVDDNNNVDDDAIDDDDQAFVERALVDMLVEELSKSTQSDIPVNDANPTR